MSRVPTLSELLALSTVVLSLALMAGLPIVLMTVAGVGWFGDPEYVDGDLADLGFVASMIVRTLPFSVSCIVLIFYWAFVSEVGPLFKAAFVLTVAYGIAMAVQTAFSISALGVFPTLIFASVTCASLFLYRLNSPATSEIAE